MRLSRLRFQLACISAVLSCFAARGWAQSGAPSAPEILPPFGLEVEQTCPCRVDLRWPLQRPRDAGGYIVERLEVSSGNGFEPIATLPASATLYHDRDVRERARYRYRLSRWAPVGRSSPSGVMEIVTGAESNGSIVSYNHITILQVPGATGLDDFGAGVAWIGDLDGDGHQDLAVGAPRYDAGASNSGAVWILFLDADANLLRSKRIITSAAFTLPANGNFGEDIAAVGDLDGDQVPDIVVSNGSNRAYLLFLTPDGDLKDHRFLAIAGESVEYIGDVNGDGFIDLARDNRILFLDADGAIIGTELHGNLGGSGANRYGSSIAHLGDVDGDGNTDIAVGAPWTDIDGHDDAGAIWIVFLDEQGKTKSRRRLPVTELGRLRTMGFGFGFHLAGLGDLDGDGTPDLIAGEPTRNDFSSDYGVLWILFLNPDGSLRDHQRISDHRGGLGETTRFGGMLDVRSGPGSPGGTHGPEIYVAAGTRDGFRGVLLMELGCNTEFPRIRERFGSDLDARELYATSSPRIGTDWTAELYCLEHEPAPAYHFGFTRPAEGFFTPFGELLVDLSSELVIFRYHSTHFGFRARFRHNIPLATELIGLEVYTQGLCLGFPGPRLSHGLDVIVGR